MTEITQKVIGSNNSQVTNITMPNGDKHPLACAMESILGKIEDDPDYEGFIEELLYYTHTKTLIGLEGKLKEANREDLLCEAIDLKERFAKKLEREQLSLTIQHFYIHFLAYIKSVFKTKIKPLVAKGVPPAELDSAIYREIVLDIYKETSKHLPDFTTDHIAGMLYYLTGKCHISWRA